MEKLSVLMFSRNDVGSVINLVKDVYSIADEIVLVDSSDRKERNQLYKEKARLGLSKLRIFYAVPLGIVEAYREYGLKLCKNSWILYLDTDEALSRDLKRDIKKIISTTKYDAFTIKRYEYVEKGELTSLYTWNTKLYRRGKARYRGIIHEQPVIRGKVGRLEDKYYIENRVEYHNFLTGYEYNKLYKLERLSYKEYNKLLLEQVGKVLSPDKRVGKTEPGRLLKGLLTAYEKMTFRDPEEELSDFDYFAYRTIKYFVFYAKQRDIRGILRLLPEGLDDNARIKGWKSEPDGKEMFEIAKIVYKAGIIDFLGLDKEEKMMELNRKYKDRKIKGADLLISLLKEKYEQINSK